MNSKRDMAYPLKCTSVSIGLGMDRGLVSNDDVDVYQWVWVFFLCIVHGPHPLSVIFLCACCVCVFRFFVGDLVGVSECTVSETVAIKDDCRTECGCGWRWVWVAECERMTWEWDRERYLTCCSHTYPYTNIMPPLHLTPPITPMSTTNHLNNTISLLTTMITSKHQHH